MSKKMSMPGKILGQYVDQNDRPVNVYNDGKKGFYCRSLTRGRYLTTGGEWVPSRSKATKFANAATLGSVLRSVEGKHAYYKAF